MLAKVASVGGTALSERHFALACIALSASNLPDAPAYRSLPRKRVWDPLVRKSRVFSRPPSNKDRFVHSREDLSSVDVGIARCRMTDGFLEGADGDGNASDCLAPSEGIQRKEEISVLWSLIQDVEPLDASRVGQDVSNDSKDAMKRTISGMLGLLPSDSFHIAVEASREPLAKLLISSVMTGYTLRNAEYRVCLQRSLELAEVDGVSNSRLVNENVGMGIGTLLDETDLVNEETIFEVSQNQDETDLANEGTTFEGSQNHFENTCVESDFGHDSLHSLSPEVQNYIKHLKSRLSAVTQELEDCKRKNHAMGITNVVGEKNNDLLNYLRSLDTEKVSELSRPSSEEVEELIRQVVNRCLQAITVSELPTVTKCVECKIAKGAPEQECKHSQSSFRTSRDYLARLLFWCMLFGHHLRALEYRLELSRTLSLC